MIRSISLCLCHSFRVADDGVCMKNKSQMEDACGCWRPIMSAPDNTAGVNLHLLHQWPTFYHMVRRGEVQRWLHCSVPFSSHHIMKQSWPAYVESNNRTTQVPKLLSQRLPKPRTVSSRRIRAESAWELPPPESSPPMHAPSWLGNVLSFLHCRCVKIRELLC